MLVLLCGLVVFGRDGKMATYASLVLACASSQWLLLRARTEDDRTTGRPRRARTDVCPSRAVLGIGTSLENEPNASSVATFANTTRSSSSMTSSVAGRPTRLTRPRGVGARKMPFTNAVSPGR